MHQAAKGTRHTVMNKTDPSPCPHWGYVLVTEPDDKYSKYIIEDVHKEC